VWVENKGLSLAVHYRQSPDGDDAERRILAATGKLEGVRVFGGKKVVNLLLEDTADKGRALAAERHRLGCDWVLYVGDDENDEAAFALNGNVVGVRVGRKESSHARYYLRDQTEIESLLRILVGDALSRGETAGSSPLTKMA
jgi:trehalose 6-phosphate phosphatase